MAEVTGKALDWKLLKRVMHYVTPYRGIFVLAAFLTVFLAVAALAQPILMQLAVDNYIMVGNYDGLVFIIILMIVQLVVQTIAQYYQTYMTNSLGESVIRDLRISWSSRLKY